jgi:hypothetical protein
MNPAGELSQLVERRAQLGIGLVQELGRSVRLAAELRARELQREPEPEQALLCPVVEVTLESLPFLVSRGHDARSGGAELDELRPQLGLQALVRERQPGCGADRVEQALPLEQRRVVDERSDRVVGTAEPRHRPARSRSRQRDGQAARVHVALPLGQPERELERRVAEGPRQRVAHRSRRRPLQLDDEAGDRAVNAVPPEEPDRKRDRDRERRGGHDPEPGRMRPRVDRVPIHDHLHAELDDHEAHGERERDHDPPTAGRRADELAHDQDEAGEREPEEDLAHHPVGVEQVQPGDVRVGVSAPETAQDVGVVRPPRAEEEGEEQPVAGRGQVQHGDVGTIEA